MEQATDGAIHTATVDAPPTPEPQEALLEDLLVEDVSIDGMCGVY